MAKKKDCRICSDLPCKNDLCIREKYVIKDCAECPAAYVCIIKPNDKFCKMTKAKIENIVNSMRERANI